MRIAYYSYHCDLPKIWVWRSQNSNQRLLVQQPCKDLALITMKMSLTTTDLNDHWRTVCGHGIFQYKTFLTFPPFPPMEVEWMTHRPTSPSVHIGKWLVGGKPNCNYSRNWAFRTDPGSHFHYGSLRHSSHFHFRILFSLLCLDKERHCGGVGSAQDTAGEKKGDHCWLQWDAGLRTYRVSPEAV